MEPKITVLMAVYNGAAYLKDCIESVLRQTHRDFEFLIVDDGSTDTTRDIIRAYRDNRICLMENGKNLSQVTSLNIGLDYACGEYIARIDADDIMLPHRLERQLDFLTRRKDVALVGSLGEAIDEKGATITRCRLPLRNEEIIATIFFETFISIHSSVMYRKEVVLGIGKYDEVFSFTEDYKLITNLMLSGHKVNNMPEVLIKYRIHNDRISVRDSKPQIERYIIAFKQFMGNLTKDFSESDHDLLFNFLIRAGSLNKEFWGKEFTEKDIKKIIELLDMLLSHTTQYFNLKRHQQYFMKKIFYNRILNIVYRAPCIKNSINNQLYLYCLKNWFFVMAKPKLYIYPFKTAQ